MRTKGDAKKTRQEEERVYGFFVAGDTGPQGTETMKIYVLFGQRKEDYPGQYAPEALDVMDEFGWDENSEYLLDKLDERSKDPEWIGLEIVPIEFGDMDTLRKLLMREHAPFQGGICEI